MRNFVAVSASILLMGASSVALAGETGIYIGAGVGAYTLDIDDTSFDDNATVARIFGGFQFTENLAIEGEYQKLFEAEDDLIGVDTELEADVWTVSLRPILPITDLIDVYGKIGYSHYEVDAQTTILGSTFSGDDSDNAFSWGGGIDFNLGNLSIRGEVSRIEVDDADLNLVSAGLVFRF